MPCQSVLWPVRMGEEGEEGFWVATMVLTAPMVAAAGSISSRSGMMSSLRGMVTLAPPKSGERRMDATSEALVVSWRP